MIGVVDNRTTRLLGLGATSNVFFLKPLMAVTPVVRIDRRDVSAALAEIDGVWNRLMPQIAIKRRFADELLGEALATFELVSSVFAGITVLALVIAVLGLIGMSIHSIGRRTHEIGVRKTRGASVRGIVTLLLRDFSKPVLVANLIAWPLAFVAMNGYLSIFTNRVGLTWKPFATSLLLTVVYRWFAVSVQVIRAARMKPARVLREDKMNSGQLVNWPTGQLARARYACVQDAGLLRQSVPRVPFWPVCQLASWPVGPRCSRITVTHRRSHHPSSSDDDAHQRVRPGDGASPASFLRTRWWSISKRASERFPMQIGSPY